MVFIQLVASIKCSDFNLLSGIEGISFTKQVLFIEMVIKNIMMICTTNAWPQSELMLNN